MSDIDISKSLSPNPPQASEDARALLARLYREIGISAVTEALQLRDLPELDKAEPIPAATRGADLAA